MDRLDALIAGTAAIAVLSTVVLTLAIFESVGGLGGSLGQLLGEAGSAVRENPVLSLFQMASLAVAPTSWAVVSGLIVWRGQIRAKWIGHGLDRDVFRLMVRMKGSQNRVAILRAMSSPVDRNKLAKDLGLDWTTVDHHISILTKYGLVQESLAYGNVRVYHLTNFGTELLKALDEMK